METSKLNAIVLLVVLNLSQLAFGRPLGGYCDGAIAQMKVLPKGLPRSEVDRQIEGYLTDTLSGLEKMRGENGLLNDTVRVQSEASGKVSLHTLNSDTSPTNIAVDLLIQAERASVKTIIQIINTLEKLDFHSQTGLFYSRYTTDRTSTVKDLSVSSIDNLHLAIALWTVKETFQGTKIAETARLLFERMDFSVYYDVSTGLIGGNLKYIDGKWIREAYNFANLGSEARALYSVGWALGLFKNSVKDSDFLEKAFASLKVEVLHTVSGDILKLWDGSAFQLFFPKIFINEDLYSSKFKLFYEAAGNFMISEGKRRHLPMPAAHSAVRASVDEPTGRKGEPAYKDKAGNAALVSSDNNDMNDPNLKARWESTFTPYALFMAATSNPEKFIPSFLQIVKIRSGDDLFYQPSLGWMDGLQVKGPSKGLVVPAQLSLNQGMIALSLLQMQASDGLSLSSRLLYSNSQVRGRLQDFYNLFEAKLEGLP